MKSFLRIIILVLISSSCQDNNDNPLQLVCDNSSSNFSNLYNDILVSENLSSYDTVESLLHAYIFKVSSEKQVCSIGYQSFHSDPTVPYDIIIKEEATGTILYSESHIFTQNSMSYVTLSQNIVLQPDTEYVLSRLLTVSNESTEDIMGNVIDGYQFSVGVIHFLPYTFNELTILSTRFYHVGTEIEVDVDNFLPEIDIVFAE